MTKLYMGTLMRHQSFLNRAPTQYNTIFTFTEYFLISDDVYTAESRSYLSEYEYVHSLTFYNRQQTNYLAVSLHLVTMFNQVVNRNAAYIVKSRFTFILLRFLFVEKFVIYMYRTQLPMHELKSDSQICLK